MKLTLTGLSGRQVQNKVLTDGNLETLVELVNEELQMAGNGMTGELSRSVQMQFIRPAQLEAAVRAFPVVYVLFGLIEWHGRHLPLGNDALKAHAFLLLLGDAKIPPPYRFNIFQHAASSHLAILLGNTIYEATIPLSITFIMSQFAEFIFLTGRSRIYP